MAKEIKFVFFGSSRFSEFVLEELAKAGFSPIKKVTSAKEDLPRIPADFYIVASFGKIIPKEILDIPKYGSLNVHPSLLPKLRGPSPIQNLILGHGEPGVTITRMDEQMDHGPIVAQEKAEISPWPDHYTLVEEKFARAGGKLLVKVLNSEIKETPQDHREASFTKMVRKVDGLLNLDDPAEINLRKVLAYSTWPEAYFFHKRENGKEIRVIVKDAKIENSKLKILSVIPAGKREMDWTSFLRGNA